MAACSRSLLRQLSAQELPDAVKALHKQAQKYSPSLEELMETLNIVLQEGSTAFLVFDALDECKEVKILMEKIAEIAEMGAALRTHSGNKSERARHYPNYGYPSTTINMSSSQSGR